MDSRRYPTALEVERILWYLERPMTMRAISRETGIRYDRVRYGMISLRYQGLVKCTGRRGGGQARSVVQEVSPCLRTDAGGSA